MVANFLLNMETIVDEVNEKISALQKAWMQHSVPNWINIVDFLHKYAYKKLNCHRETILMWQK